MTTINGKHSLSRKVQYRQEQLTSTDRQDRHTNPEDEDCAVSMSTKQGQFIPACVFLFFIFNNILLKT